MEVVEVPLRTSLKNSRPKSDASSSEFFLLDVGPKKPEILKNSLMLVWLEGGVREPKTCSLLIEISPCTGNVQGRVGCN